MPPFRVDDFGPALCSEHVIKVNEDQRELRMFRAVGESRSRAPPPCRSGGLETASSFHGIQLPVLTWEDFLEALRSSFHPKDTAGAPHSCAAGGTPRARGSRRGSGRHPGRHYFGRTVNMASRIAATASAG
jgi:hypothetical protein